MNKANELLRKALGILDMESFELSLQKEIRAYLAAEEGKQKELIYLGSKAHLEHLAEEAECAYMVLDDDKVPRSDDNGDVYSLVGRIKRYGGLRNEQRKQEEEPVAWTNQDELNALGTDVTCYMYAEPEAGDIPLFLRPSTQSKQREPLSYDELGTEFARYVHDVAELDETVKVMLFGCFYSGVRWAEKMHKIGGAT